MVAPQGFLEESLIAEPALEVSGAPDAIALGLNVPVSESILGRRVQWDAENRLVGIVQASGTTGFVYDGAGHRVQETLNGNVIKQWVWCGSQPCEERDGLGNVTKRFYAQGEQIAGVPYYFTRDHLGSIREMTDDTGAIRARYDYDPYGRVTKMSGDLDADFGFTGDYFHKASGLSLTIYRAYDPNLGRWLNRDPIGEAGGLNLYAYVGNNPLNYRDPDGRNPAAAAIPIILEGGGGGAAIGAGAIATGGIVIAGGIGYGIGTLIDQYTGISTIVANAIDPVDWKPQTRDKAQDKMGGQDCDVTKGKKLTPEQREKLKRQIEDQKQSEGRGGADNLNPDQTGEILDDITGGGGGPDS